jgi:hypothetical protein
MEKTPPNPLDFSIQNSKLAFESQTSSGSSLLLGFVYLPHARQSEVFG